MKTFEYTSSVTGTKRHCSFYIPHDPESRAPQILLFVLHGIGGDENEWAHFGDPTSILDDLVSSHSIPPLVALFPNGRASVPDSAPSNPFEPYAIEGFARFGDELLQDLLPLAHKTFSIPLCAENRIICGLSMGGGQALNIGLSNPHVFSRIGAFSPAPNTDVLKSLEIGINNRNNEKKLSRKDQYNDLSCLHSVSKGIAEKFPHVWLCCGVSDSLLEVTQTSEKFLNDAGVQLHTEYIEGDHDWNVWNYGLRHSLAFFWKETT